MSLKFNLFTSQDIFDLLDLLDHSNMHPFQASYKELGLLALVVIMGMLIFSGLTFVVEKDANPDEFISLPAALYWAIITMTSVSILTK